MSDGRSLSSRLWEAYHAAVLVERCDRAILEYDEAGISGTPHDLENRLIRADALARIKELLGIAADDAGRNVDAEDIRELVRRL